MATEQEMIDKSFWISPEERVKFYLNNQESFEIDLQEFEEVKQSDYWNKSEMKLVSYKKYENTFVHWYCKNLVYQPLIRNIRVLPFYRQYKHLHSLMNFFAPFDKLGLDKKDTVFPFYYGETGYTGDIPCIRKSRRADDTTSVIYNFRTLRLTAPCDIVRENDIPWAQKEDNVVWRGATTGEEQRVNFVEKYFDKFDVGFATIKQKPEKAHLKKEKVSIKDQLKYKFIISLEGNDVASNLRWVLASNSIPIMTKPHWQSWIMEEKLQPNVHYLELNKDLSNLDELLTWAANNNEACQQIAENGKNYMAQFLDEENDLPVQKLLLEEYANRLTYKD